MQEMHWVQVVCKVTDWNQNFYYMSCPKCIKATLGQIDTLFWCDYCKQRVQATPSTCFDNRCRFQIQLADSTGFITATAFGQQADSMFSISGDYLKNNIKKVRLEKNIYFVLIMEKFSKFFHPLVLAPAHGVVAIYSGILVYYIRIDNHELTLGWYDIVADHKFGDDYTILLASVGHLLFDLYIFDEEGCQVKYPWTTTAAINHPNAPPGTIFTGCMPSAFRSMGHELRFQKKLTNGDLVALELCQSIKQFAKELKMNTFMLVTKQRIWEIQHIAGYLVGHGWYAYVAAHTLRCHDTLIFSLDSHLRLRVLIFNEARRERTYDWY
ncbi:hypothetical protein RHMOL_Rhmol09G0121500 [Rhododendron molle]|uniref:Uncharacterized protein n=1 Tax=Rhododendron molle TaxID=49168 RepID=A0ACC0MDH9_RHOML|nr:hypothetical protein RHMOL_Rhmol09G0121500 [Rhododendron molle]